MKTKLLNIPGVEVISKESQKSIGGGIGPVSGGCHCICGLPLPPYCSPCFIDPCRNQDQEV